VTNQFTAIIEQDMAWFIACSPEIPRANGQGRTKDEARERLAEGPIRLTLYDPAKTVSGVFHRGAILDTLPSGEEKEPYSPAKA
jgi:hypothetical protein